VLNNVANRQADKINEIQTASQIRDRLESGSSLRKIIAASDPVIVQNIISVNTSSK
jgi:type II secretory pathway component PulF